MYQYVCKAFRVNRYINILPNSVMTPFQASTPKTYLNSCFRKSKPVFDLVVKEKSDLTKKESEKNDEIRMVC